MKQTIGYMKYDYMLVKGNFWTFVSIFGILSAIFVKMQSSLFAIGYLLFGGLVYAGTTFTKIPQTVSFTALVPGRTLHKVLGRYLWTLICVGVSLFMGGIIVCMMKWTGAAQGNVELPAILLVLGIILFFLAFQNMLLYLLVPFIGVQMISLVRMVPGFLLFFGVMQMSDTPFLRKLMQNEMLFGLTVLGIGAVSMLLSIAVSCLAVRNRDNE